MLQEGSPFLWVTYIISIWTKELQLPDNYATVTKNINTLSDNMPASYEAQLGDEFGKQ